MPAMLAVGDDTVVVMDRVLRRRRDGSSACCFEALRRLPGGRGWRAGPGPGRRGAGRRAGGGLL
jgi:hypothetical protein